jgi:hypothetical protein
VHLRLKKFFKIAQVASLRRVLKILTAKDTKNAKNDLLIGFTLISAFLAFLAVEYLKVL